MSIEQRKTDLRNAGWTYPVREVDERALLAGCYYDAEAAAKVVTFFEKHLRHTMGHHAGKPFALLDWQKHILCSLFGWKRSDGQRRYSKGDIFVAKKQGKSTLAAGIVNWMLISGGERAEVYGVAHTRDQAGIIYREAAAMARTSPLLKDRLKPIDSQKRLVFHRKASFYHALAGEASSKGVEGINPVAVIFDEIHVQRSRELYDGLAYASAARPNSLMLSVSTVGVADVTSIWWEQYEYAKGVLDGTIQDIHRFAYVAQADDDCLHDWEKCGELEQWRKAMPSLEKTVQPEKIRQAYEEATNAPAKQNAFRRYLLNVPTQQAVRVIPIEDWNACRDELPDLSGRRCFGGLDMASKEDLTCFALYFPGDPAYVISWFWCPSAKVDEREKRHQGHYRQWINSGWLEETEGNRVDHYAIEQCLRRAFAAYDVQEIAFDPWNADAVVNPLVNEEFPLVAIGQGIAQQTSGCTGLIDDIKERRIRHDGNEVMTWCLGNAAADVKDDAIKFSKSKSADKIDGAVALAMAVGRAMANVSDSVPMIF